MKTLIYLVINTEYLCELISLMDKSTTVCTRNTELVGLRVVVRLSVHAHFNLGLSPRDSCVPEHKS